MIQQKQKIFFQINEGEKTEVMETDGRVPFNLLTITEYPKQEQIGVKHYLFVFTDKSGNSFKISTEPVV